MKPSVKVVVADSSPLIALARLGLLELLPELFDGVLVPRTVLTECTVSEGYAEGVPISDAVSNGWIVLVDDPVSASAWNLDAGEASAIAVALERQAGVVMDDQAGRRTAGHLKLPVIGTAGILVLAKRRGLITAVRPHLEVLTHSGYFLGEQLLATVLRLVGEE